MATFLKSIRLKFFGNSSGFPFNIPAYQKGLEIDVKSPFLILVGENGSGKSTLLEAIAEESGFNIKGGSYNHHFGKNMHNALSENITLSWFPKIKRGFYLRAENFISFSDYIDELAEVEPGYIENYGGKSLKKRSHGEGFFTLFKNQFQKGIFILDEPETALSPNKQIEFLALISSLVQCGDAQFIMATHSPIIMSIPNAQVLEVSDFGIEEVNYKDTNHYQTTRLFLDSPERFYKQF